MQWFKVAANLWCHPKWLKLSPQAKALWVTAASWCSQNDTFGRVSPEFLKSFSQVSRPNRVSQELVNAGLWEVADDGYQFHDWDEHNIDKTAWESGKAAVRERVKRHREKQRNAVSNAVSNGGRNAVTNAVSNANVTLQEEEEEKEEEYITPLTPLEGVEAEPFAALTDKEILEASFDEFWQAYPRHEGKKAAKTRFVQAVKQGTSPEAIVAGARRFAADPNLPEKRFIPHPATWLNQARWEDDPLPARTTSGAGAMLTRSQQAAALAMRNALAERDRASPPQLAALPAAEQEVAR